MSADDFFKRLRNRKPKPEEPPGAPNEQDIQGSPAGEPHQPSKLDKTQSAQQRQKQLAESFLDNEALTEGLDDRTAKALIDWSIDISRRVLESARDLPADQADVHVERRSGAARRLILAARDLALQQPAAGEKPRAFRASKNQDVKETQPQPIASLAQEVYGGKTTDEPFLPADLLNTVMQSANSPEQRITALRQAIEEWASRQAKHYSHQHDEEEDRSW